MSLPIVFVGSSSEQLPIVTGLLLTLDEKAAVKPWTRSFQPGVLTLDALMANANEADFAVFIFGPDDWTESRSVGSTSPRDNVVFEAGLFGGILGWGRSIIVHAKGVKLPSDLEGLTRVSYDAGRDPELEATKIGVKIADVIDKRGWRGSESFAGQIQGHWWQLTVTDAVHVERSVLSLVHICRSGSIVSLSGRSWTREGDLIAQFASRAASVDEQRRTLFYYWEGDWPGHPDVPQFYGKGEISLEDANRASGYFTIRSDGSQDPRERKTVVYRRATPADLESVKSENALQIRDLIRQQLEKRKGLLFGGAERSQAAPGTQSKAAEREA